MPAASNKRQPWERQRWESDTRWRAFLYYRDMPTPRSVDGAYRLHFAASHQLQLSDDSVTKKRAIGGWQAWSRGQRWNGTSVDGALTWEARANAYDTYLDQQVEAELQKEIVKRRVKLVRDELQDYDAQLGKFREVWERTRLHERTRTERVKGEQGQDVEIVTVELNIDDWLKLSRWRDNISGQGRRVLNLPAEIAQTQLTGKDGGAVQLDLLHADDLASLFHDIRTWERAQRDGGTPSANQSK